MREVRRRRIKLKCDEYPVPQFHSESDSVHSLQPAHAYRILDTSTIIIIIIITITARDAHLKDGIFDSSVGHQSVYVDRSSLPFSPHSAHSLLIHSGIPITVKHNQSRSSNSAIRFNIIRHSYELSVRIESKKGFNRGDQTYKLIPTPPALEESKNRNLRSEVLLKLSTKLCLLSVGTEP